MINSAAQGLLTSAVTVGIASFLVTVFVRSLSRWLRAATNGGGSGANIVEKLGEYGNDPGPEDWVPESRAAVLVDPLWADTEPFMTFEQWEREGGC
jgi:hypothetical protein